MWKSCRLSLLAGLLLLPLPAFAAQRAGQVPPAPTAAGQELYSGAYQGGFTWQTVSWYNTNGTQVAVGGSVDSTSRLSVSPQGASENGLTVNMPSAATGYALLARNSTGGILFGITRNPAASNIITRPGTTSTGQRVLTLYNPDGGVVAYLGGMAGDLVSSSYGYIPGFNFSGIGLGGDGGTNVINLGASGGNGVLQNDAGNLQILAGKGIGTNQPGNPLTLAGGKSTGTGAEGVVNIATSGSGATGTALNALTNRVTVSQAGLTVLGTGTVNSPAYQVGGTAGYTGTIPTTAQSFHFVSGVLVGYTNSAGTLVGN